MIKLQTCKGTGYLMARIARNGAGKTVTIHRLMAHAFLGKCPEGYQVNHKNGIKTDNTLDNLEYVLPSANVAHSCELGLMPYGERKPNRKLSDAIVREVRERRKQGVTALTMARDYGVGKPTIENVFAGTTWKRVK